MINNMNDMSRKNTPKNTIENSENKNTPKNTMEHSENRKTIEKNAQKHKSHDTYVVRKKTTALNRSSQLLVVWVMLLITFTLFYQASGFIYIYDFMSQKAQHDAKNSEIFLASEDNSYFWGISDENGTGIWMDNMRLSEDTYKDNTYTFCAKLIKVHEEKYIYRYELAVLEYSSETLSTNETTIYVNDLTEDNFFAKYNSWEQDDSQECFKIKGTYKGTVEDTRTTRTLSDKVLKFDAVSVEKYDTGIGESTADLINKNKLFRNYSSNNINAELATELNGSSIQQRYCVMDGIITERELLSSDYCYYHLDVDGNGTAKGMTNIKVFLNNFSKDNLYVGENVRIKGEIYGSNHQGSVFVYVYSVEELPKDYEFNHNTKYTPNKCQVSDRDFHTIYYDKNLKKYNNGSDFESHSVIGLDKNLEPSDKFLKKIRTLYANSIHTNVKKYLEGKKTLRILLCNSSKNKDAAPTANYSTDGENLCIYEDEATAYLPHDFIWSVGGALFIELSNDDNLKYYADRFDRYVVLEFGPFIRTTQHDNELSNARSYFASAYFAYVQYPEVLEKYCPNTYRYIDNLIKKLGEQ